MAGDRLCGRTTNERATMLTNAIATAAGTASEVHFEIPMRAEAYGLIALGSLMALLALTFAFRSIGNRH